jgi:hypothetical protein
MNNIKLEILSTDSNVTKNVKRAFNRLSDAEFLYQYGCSKRTYYKRVKKYSDPYMKAPLARLGKWLLKHQLFTN